MFTNTAEQIINMKDAPKSGKTNCFYIGVVLLIKWRVKLGDKSSDAAFAMYYGKFQGIAPKANQIIALVEGRLEQNIEYEHLLNEIHKMYLTQRAGVRQLQLIKADFMKKINLWIIYSSN